MPPRKEQPQEVPEDFDPVDSVQVLANPAATAGVGEYPSGFESMPDQWKAMFDQAAKKGNTVKAAVVFANHHMDDEPPNAS